MNSFKLNQKSLAVGRLMERGKNGDPRLKYIHCGPKGTTVVSQEIVARVSLPNTGNQPSVPVIFPQDIVDDTLPTLDREKATDMPEGRPAVTGPDYLVPQLDKLFPDPNDQSSSFTCNAESLLKILKAACEVTNDSDKTIKLRIFPTKGCIRVDTYRQPGEQEFCAILKEIEYVGDRIPGDKTDPNAPAPVVEVKPVQTTLGLTATSGRKFRG